MTAKHDINDYETITPHHKWKMMTGEPVVVEEEVGSLGSRKSIPLNRIKKYRSTATLDISTSTKGGQQHAMAAP